MLRARRTDARGRAPRAVVDHAERDAYEPVDHRGGTGGGIFRYM